MATDRGYIKFFYFFIVISLVSSIFYISFIEVSFSQKDDNDDDKNDDKLVVKARIHLENIDMEKTKFIRVIGFINGEESKQDIQLSSIDKTNDNLNVELKVNKENNIVEANTPDEYFVCAYQVGDISKEFTPITKFDCNESDILSTSKPNVINLFQSGSQVYSKSQAVYQASLNTNSSSSNSDKVKIKISAPLADKKGTEKLKIGVMIKGQIQSAVIEDVQAELDKSKDSTIKKTFTFDRNTDLGPIQIGDRYHACVSSEDLRPPEGTECEKRMIKNLDTVSGLYAR
jgi:hypothetical protein